MAHSVSYSASPHSALDQRPYPSLSSLLSSSSSLASPPPLSSRPNSGQLKQHWCIGETNSNSCASSQNPLFHGRSLTTWPWRRKASFKIIQLQSSSSGSFGGGYGGNTGGGGSGGGGGDGHGRDDEENNGGHHAARKHWRIGLFSSLSDGWRERVCADPQFPFKILTEEIIGVAASVFGDMSCRPGFGLGELDFVFSNLIVCAIVNFALMYILAPTPSTAAGGGSLPGLLASCPPGHMWEVGAYSLAQRAGTFVYKGALFAAVGFGAGLVGTALSTMLLNIRKKLDPSFSLQNVPPPTLLNACTWALQLGLSSNSRYQLLNGLEFGLEGAMNPSIFKGLVFGIRSLNNVVGGMSFMMMARLTGAQDRPKQVLEMQS